ncbi:MAG: protein phosphatase 2C domain-containing protein [Synergistaceae bacterium]|jgi:protein phosphatase|nr:protein phosphatase 2C domain-containing protein [Synergistaceae bacterium]
MKMNLSFSARSHIGRVRINNEDNLYCDGAAMTPENRDAPFALSGGADTPCIFAVCDGMGGEADGEFASLTAVAALAEHAEAIESAASAEADEIHTAVRKFVTDANGRLCDAMRAKPGRMGTTLALAVVTDEAVYAYNLGDSRIYVLKEGRVCRLSEDHTLAAQKVEMGLLTEEEARTSRWGHSLTRHLGLFEDEMIVVPAAAEPLPIGGGCRLLLCSDGLTDMVRDARIEEILRSGPAAEDAAERLLAEALRNGGRDNVTCVVVDVTPVPARAAAQ